jgi:RNA polymerase sigma-70 factor, ECF subfamily
MRIQNPPIKSSVEDVEQIFNDSYSVIFDKLYRYIVCRVPNNQDAEDILSETFFKAWKSLKTYNLERGSLDAWIFGILKRKIIKFYKRNTIPLISYERIREISDDWDSMEANISDNLQIKMNFEKFMSGLKKEEAALCFLHYIDGYKYSEIADKVGKKPSAVRKWFSRFKNKFLSRTL